MDELIKEIKGLSEKEAQNKLIRDGYNELPGEKPRNVWRIFRSILSEPMFILLLVCAGLYFLLSDIKEALTLGALNHASIKHILLCHLDEKPVNLNMMEYPHLPHVFVTTTKPQDYGQLLEGSC